MFVYRFITQYLDIHSLVQATNDRAIVAELDHDRGLLKENLAEMVVRLEEEQEKAKKAQEQYERLSASSKDGSNLVFYKSMILKSFFSEIEKVKQELASEQGLHSFLLLTTARFLTSQYRKSERGPATPRARAGCSEGP